MVFAKRRLAILALCCAAFFTAGPVAAADDLTAEALRIEKAWTRATPAGASTAGAYLSIVNAGFADDRLVAVASPRASMAQIHEMRVVDGVMTMRPLDGGLPIPAGETLVLKPGGFHIMLTGLSGPIAEGETVELRLTFERAGEATVAMTAAAIGAGGPMTDRSNDQ